MEAGAKCPGFCFSGFIFVFILKKFE